MSNNQEKIIYCIEQLEKFDSITNGYVKHNIRMNVIKVLKELIEKKDNFTEKYNLEAYELGN